MEFYNHTTIYHSLKSQGIIVPNVDWKTFYDENSSFLERHSGEGSSVDFLLEAVWLANGSPYYLVYPAIVPMLTKLDLTRVPSSNIQPAHTSMHLRFPIGPKNPCRFDVEYDTGKKSVCLQGITWYFVKVMDPPFLSLWFDFGEDYAVPIKDVVCPNFWSKEVWKAAKVPGLLDILSSGKKPKEDFVLATAAPLSFRFNTFLFRNFKLYPDKTVQENLGEIKIFDSLSRGWKIEESVIEFCIRLAITTIMVDAGDTFLLEPDILRDDELKHYDRELTEEEWSKYQAKAVRRGKKGWHLGRQYEEELSRRVPGTPYVTPPHPCHFHVGKGRTKTIVKVRKGWMANRKVAETVPSGYGSCAEEELIPVIEPAEPTELSTGN